MYGTVQTAFGLAVNLISGPVAFTEAFLSQLLIQGEAMFLFRMMISTIGMLLSL